MNTRHDHCKSKGLIIFASLLVLTVIYLVVFLSGDGDKDMWWVALINPSYIALCFIVPVTFGRAGAVVSTILFFMAFLLHGFAALVWYKLNAYGAAWSGGPKHSDMPLRYFVAGCLVLFVLIVIKVVRSYLFRRNVEQAQS